jgi:DNA-binding transcriptional ArsR family regulator
MAYITAMDTFTALADPTRRHIIELLATREQTFGELADRFEMSRPAVSQHLKVLRDANIVASRPDAQRRVYRLNDNALDDLEHWITSVRRFWSGALDELERALSEPDTQGEK